MSAEDKINGFIVIDKPKGPTSHQVDYWIREILGIRKVGHVGTLDPNASGVLVMALGNAVKLIDVAHESPKEYVAVMKLHSEFSMEKLQAVFRDFTTEIYQIPPMRSAVARNLRKRRIFEMELLEVSGRNVLFRTKCESGTYIRTLCTDMGYMICFGGQMSELRRTSTGPFTESQCCTLQDVSDAVKLKESGDSSMWSNIFIPIDYLFRSSPKIVVKNSAIDNISHGSDLFPGGIKAVLGNPKRGDRVALISEKNQLLGTGIMLVSYEEILDVKVVDLDRVLIEPSGAKKDESKPQVVGSGGWKGKTRVQGHPGKVHTDFRRSKKGGNTGGFRRRDSRDSRPQGPPDKVRRVPRKK